MKRLAILNRGEAASRLLNGVAEFNGESTRLHTIALYTDVDRHAGFVRAADEALSLGSSSFVDPRDGQRKHTYVDQQRVLRALRQASADAVWVGWGFLSESAEFARRCEAEGILFIGPRWQTMARLASKTHAKIVAEEARVPVVPWSGGPVESLHEAMAAGDRIGYPLFVKAAGGGGGRGIRHVRRSDDLAPALAEARREARSAFDDDTVFLERAVTGARHVEVQVLGDSTGKVWVLGTRDCSVQRRRQKLLEEAGAVDLPDDIEQEMRRGVVRMCQALSYVNAGTFEFLYHPARNEVMFLEANTRLQVEHTVTEETTGIDLVKMQLHVAFGGQLEGEPPMPRGHAIEVRLNAEDADRGFSPAPGDVVLFRPAHGPGIRVDTGIAEGDAVAPEFDSMVAKIIARGNDRHEALTRLARALRQTQVLVRGGTTNRSFLLHLVQHADIRNGPVDTEWLDRLISQGSPATRLHAEVAVLQAAVECYVTERRADVDRFLASAARGRPVVRDEAGRRVELRYLQNRYVFTVHQLDAHRFRIMLDGGVPTDAVVDFVSEFERIVTLGARKHRVLALADGPSYMVEVEGESHRITRDESGVIRAQFPGVVVSVFVEPGQHIAVGDPLVLLESMKMESTLTAPFAGRVRDIVAVRGGHVDSGEVLIRADPAGEDGAGSATSPRLRFGIMTVDARGEPPEWAVFERLRSLILGYDPDPSLDEHLTAELRTAQVALPPGDAALLEAEEDILQLFTDVTALLRPGGDPDADVEQESVMGGEEHLLTYLRSPERARETLPPRFVAQLERVLSRYGVDGVARSPGFGESLERLYKSQGRARLQVPPILAILDRWRRERDGLAAVVTGRTRSVLDQLIETSDRRFSAVCDSARTVRFSFFDQPVLERSRDGALREADTHLEHLAAQPHTADRDARVHQLVEVPQRLMPRLVGYMHHAAPAMREVAVEVALRRWYRGWQLEESVRTWDGLRPLIGVTGRNDRRTVHLVGTFAADVHDLADALEEVRGPLLDRLPDAEPVLEIVLHRDPHDPSGDADARTVIAALDRRSVPADRVTVTFAGPTSRRIPPSVTFERQAEGFQEVVALRGTHPAVADRLQLWRLRRFDITPVSTREPVHTFHAVARDNPNDERLVVLAEVRDLTRRLDDQGQLESMPHLELALLESIAAMRTFEAEPSRSRRPQWNRIVLFVEPRWDLPIDALRDVARRVAPATRGLGLERVVVALRARMDGQLQDLVVHMTIPGQVGVSMGWSRPSDDPIRPLSDHQQRVVDMRRRGLIHPLEILRVLVSPGASHSDHPVGSFTEHDLDESSTMLEPVDRPIGQTTANVVVGVVTNATRKCPEGMKRVVILGDPSRGLGSLGEAECRRIIAALDVAQRRGVPVEWFAVSSGARVSMDSGTENLDWSARVLRRLVEFTQAGGEVNVIVTGVNVGAQSYWNAEATMLLHTKGILVMVGDSSMVLTGKHALDFAGGISAADNTGIGGFERVMGPNGQAQYWAPDIETACEILFRHYDHTYVVPGERFPRPNGSADPVDRDVQGSPHEAIDGVDFVKIGDIFSEKTNPGRKRPFDVRSVLAGVSDRDARPLERWPSMRDAETAVVWDTHIGGTPVCLIGVESRELRRRSPAPADGPSRWTGGTLFPRSARKVARAINAASGNRPAVILANLSGFDGSPESMRELQLEHGAELARAVVNFQGPLILCVIGRYHGGAFVVFSKTLNEGLEVSAVEGSHASVIGGAPAAAVVFAREVEVRVAADRRVKHLELLRTESEESERAGLEEQLMETREVVRREVRDEIAREFDSVHTAERALRVGSIDGIVPADGIRPYIVDALHRGIRRTTRR